MSRFRPISPTIARGVRDCCNTGGCLSDSPHERDLTFGVPGAMTGTCVIDLETRTAPTAWPARPLGGGVPRLAPVRLSCPRLVALGLSSSWYLLRSKWKNFHIDSDSHRLMQPSENV